MAKASTAEERLANRLDQAEAIVVVESPRSGTRKMHSRLSLDEEILLVETLRVGLLIGASVSVDMSSSDPKTAGHRIFARVVEVMPGSDGKPVLLCEFESDNRTADQH